MKSAQKKTKKNTNAQSRAKEGKAKKSQRRAPRMGKTVSLKTTAILLMMGIEILRVVERNYVTVAHVLDILKKAPNQFLPILEQSLKNLSDENRAALFEETRASAEIAIRLTSHLFMADELVQNLNPSGIISFLYVALRELFFGDREPAQSENDRLFDWVYGIAMNFPVVRTRIESLTKRGKLDAWQLEQRENALYEFRKKRSRQERVSRIEADLRTHLTKFFDKLAAS